MTAVWSSTGPGWTTWKALVTPAATESSGLVSRDLGQDRHDRGFWPGCRSGVYGLVIRGRINYGHDGDFRFGYCGSD